MEKEVTKIDWDGSKSVAIISYKTKFIDSARFMGSSLSSFVDNIAKKLTKLNVN